MSASTWRIAVAVLWVFVLVSALGVVYGKQQARNRFNELQQLVERRDGLNTEWNQLQLEQSTWATHGRVERIAQHDLNMVTPKASELRIVQP